MCVSISPGQARQPPRIVDRRIGRDGALDRHDAAVRDADVERLAAAIGQPRIADDQIHVDYSTLMPASRMIGHHLSISAL